MDPLKCKVCGITDPKNAGAISAHRPEYMGFIFYPRSLRYVGKNPDPALFSVVHEDVEKTAVFVNEYYERMIEVTGKYGIRNVQLHGMESPETCIALRSHGLRVIKVFPGDQLENKRLLKDYEEVADYFLFDTPAKFHGGSGRKFDWSRLEKCSSRKKFFLSGGISVDDAEYLRKLELKGLFAVDINSRFETAPGMKDPVLVGDFIKRIRNEEN